MKTIAITGSSGYLGSNLVNYFLGKGDKVIALQRQAGSQAGVTYVNYSMPDAPSESDLEGVDALIHCAYQPYSVEDDGDQVNIQATLNLEKLCERLGIKMVFMSTMSAHEDAQSHYGKHKQDLENQLNQSKVLIIKSGLIIGNGGLFLKSVSAIKSSKVIPLFGGGNQPLQTIAISDLMQAIDNGLQKNLSGIYPVGESEAITMKVFYKEIVKVLGLKRYFIPFPLWLAILVVGIFEKLHIKLPFATENLIGLKKLKAFDTRTGSDEMGIQWNTYDESIRIAVQN